MQASGIHRRAQSATSQPNVQENSRVNLSQEDALVSEAAARALPKEEKTVVIDTLVTRILNSGVEDLRDIITLFTPNSIAWISGKAENRYQEKNKDS